MKARNILIEARQLITDERNWTQGALARQALAAKPTGTHGNMTSPDSPKAVCWCSIGALMKVTGTPDHLDLKGDGRKARTLLHEAAIDMGLNTAVHVNDYNRWGPKNAPSRAENHAGVLMMFDLAIERAKP